MALSRRGFIRRVGGGAVGAVSAGLFGARGSEAWQGSGGQGPSPSVTRLVRLDSNENPRGPGRLALDAIRASLPEASLYPHRAGNTLPEAIARAHGVPADHVLATCGSAEILRIVVEAFASPSRALVTALPTFETCTRTARFLKHALHEIRVNGDLALDLAGMRDRAGGAGIVFLCNPNNPTGTVHGAPDVRQFVGAVIKSSPETMILVDEAYHEYVEDPSYESAVPLAMEHPQVIVCRTFSKVHGMAGLRVGYALARPETIARMSGWRLGNGLNMLGIRAATAALGDRGHIERSREDNRAGRGLLRRFFQDAGYRVPASHANFVLADIRRDAAAFQKDCRAHGIAVGRPFPPLDSWTRVSVGTEDENRAAIDVFRRVLRAQVVRRY